MIYLAYDGSLNGDWVGRYALNLACRSSPKVLTLVHVRDPSLPERDVLEKVQRLCDEGRQVGVEVHPTFLALHKSPFDTLMSQIPEGEDNLVVCGTRLKGRHRHYLKGTVSEKLLRYGTFPVVAIRVVHPGCLGFPREFLLPLAGHPLGLRRAWPLLSRLLAGAGSVHLLRAMMVATLRQPHLLPEHQMRRHRLGSDYLEEVRQQILELGAEDVGLDLHTVLCQDWAREILLYASRLRVQMILLGASERRLVYRLLHGSPLERVLRDAPCDVGIYRGL